jgi:hypothetical protein
MSRSKIARLWLTTSIKSGDIFMKNFLTLLFVGALAVSTGFAQQKDSSAGAGCHMKCCQHDSQAVEKQSAEAAGQTGCACGMPECKDDCKCDMTRASAKSGCCGEPCKSGAHNHGAMSAKTSAPAARREVGAVARTQARFGRILPVQETAKPANAQAVASADTRSMSDCCKH